MTPQEKSNRKAELRAQYPQGRVISFTNEYAIFVVRKPTEEEVLTILDKSQVSSRPLKADDNVYPTDNGDDEILALVEYPDPAEVEAVRKRRPLLGRSVWKEVQTLCRLSLAPLDLTEEEKKLGDVVGFLADGSVRVIVKRLSIAAFERLDFKRLKTDHKSFLQSWLAAEVKKNLLSPKDDDKLWDRYPMLSGFLGNVLFGEMQVDVEAEEGESIAAT